MTNGENFRHCGGWWGGRPDTMGSLHCLKCTIWADAFPPTHEAAVWYVHVGVAELSVLVQECQREDQSPVLPQREE